MKQDLGRTLEISKGSKGIQETPKAQIWPLGAFGVLRGHHFELKPDGHPSETNDYGILEAPHPLMNLTKSCPEGSIPIERTQSNDHFGGKLLRRSPPASLQQGGIVKDGFVHQYATAVDTGRYYGGKASINLWNPQIQTEGFSLSQMWIVSEDNTTTLEAGWIVYAGLYGDLQTRLFAFFTVDDYRHGCYNLLCPGFVQTNHRFPLSAILRPTSVYGGHQFEVTIEIFRDWKTGNWWLHVQGMAMGYWPKELMRSLAKGAKTAAFGGEVASRPGRLAIPMGSGHFASKGFRKSSYFRNVRVINTSNSYVMPGNMKWIVTNNACYDLRVVLNKRTPWGYTFFYGGPGRSNNCF